MSTTQNEFDFSLDMAAEPPLLGVLRAAVHAWVCRHGASEQKADRICLAIDEAAANIIRHAYQGKPGRLRLRGQRLGDQLALELEDDAPFLDLNTIQPRPLDQVRPGGLGLHFIRHMMDQCLWTELPDGGTRLTMYASIHAAEVETTIEKEIHHA